MVAGQVVLVAVLAFFLLLGATGFVLTAAVGRLNRGRRRELAALTAELPAIGLDAVNILIRASRISVWARRLGWLFAIGVTLVTLELGGAQGDTYFIFGCAYLSAVAFGEALMPKPMRGQSQSATLDPRSAADPTLIRMDDMLRRAAAPARRRGRPGRRAAHADPPVQLARQRHVPSVRAPSSSATESLLRWLLPASALAGLAALRLVPAGASQFRPARPATSESAPGPESAPEPAPESPDA